MGDEKRSLPSKQNMTLHLRQLSLLTGGIVAREDLLTVDETEAVRENAKLIQYSSSWRDTIAFSEKSSPKFKTLIAELDELSSEGVYLWTPLSNLCGLLRPIPLDTIRWEFAFDLIPEGIIVFLSADLQDKLLLDYSSSSDGREELEIEVSGEKWTQKRLQ
jgi:hypothetical protein